MGKLGPAPAASAAGNTAATAAALPLVVFGSTAVNFSGTVSATLVAASTVHYYKFDASPGVATVECAVASAWTSSFQRTDLNCEVRVFASDGVTLLATINPPGASTPVGLGTGNSNVNLLSTGT